MANSMKLGAITNSWRNQLPTHDLSDLIQQASNDGAKHIELRQTCLGTYENGEGLDWKLDLDKVGELVNKFSNLTFNLAVASTCLTTKIDPKGDYFQGALAGAKLVNPVNPHLRTVDPNAAVAAWTSADEINEECFQLVELVKEAASQGVIISIENSGLTIGAMHVLVNAVRERLNDNEKEYLGICPDPTNQLRRHKDSNPLAELNELDLNMIKLVHYKQARNGEGITTVDDGDIDCSEMIRVLCHKGYTGIGILEIPSDDNVFDNFKVSVNYLEKLAA